MKILICGGRDYVDNQQMWRELWFYKKRVSMIIQGGAPGADRLARRWATKNQVPCLNVPARWDEHGRSAGMIRNGVMLEIVGLPDLCLAFPGGVGTEGMKRLAREAGVEVKEVD